MSLGVLNGYATAFEEVPHGGVEKDAIVVVASESLCDVEATHAAELFLAFEEEELVSLHVELATDTGVVVDDEIVDAEGVELFAAGEACGAGTDDGDLGLVDFDFARLRVVDRGQVFFVQLTDFVDIVDRCDADATDAAVDEHLACAALADAALEAAGATVDAVAVDRKTGLMEGGGDGVAFATLDFTAVEDKFDDIGLRDVENGVAFYSIHVVL